MKQTLQTSAQLGRLLRSARQAMRLTQAEVGARMGLSQKRISAIELDPGSLTAEQLLKLCAILGLELMLGFGAAAAGPSPAPNAAASQKVEW